MQTNIEMLHPWLYLQVILNSGAMNPGRLRPFVVLDMRLHLCFTRCPSLLTVIARVLTDMDFSACIYRPNNILDPSVIGYSKPYRLYAVYSPIRAC